MRLRQMGGKLHVLENGDSSKLQHVYSGPLAFIRALPSKIHKLLPSSFTFKRNSKATDSGSFEEAKELLLPRCQEQQVVSENRPEIPQSRHSPNAKYTSGMPYYPGQTSGDISWSLEDAGLALGSDLPFDAASVQTLAPMHPSIPYHLAFYHLQSISRTMWTRDREGEAHIVPPFICSGHCGPSRNSPGYRWSSELYLAREFLQKQELSYVLDLQSTGPTGIEITMCPHITVSMRKVKLRPNKDGWLRVSANISHKKSLSSEQRRALSDIPTYQRDEDRRRCYLDNVRWKSETGRLADLHSCRVCHCDLERYLELRGQRLHVRFSVYRSLGTGIDRFDPKWRSVLTGEGIPEPGLGLSAEGWYRVYGQVMRAAHLLQRPNLHTVAFRNANSGFTASPGVGTDPLVQRGDPKRGRLPSPPPRLELKLEL